MMTIIYTQAHDKAQQGNNITRKFGADWVRNPKVREREQRIETTPALKTSHLFFYRETETEKLGESNHVLLRHLRQKKAAPTTENFFIFIFSLNEYRKFTSCTRIDSNNTNFARSKASRSTEQTTTSTQCLSVILCECLAQ